MTGFSANAVIAVFFGALLAVVLFVPVVAVRYRRAGRLQPLDVVLLVACTVYGLALWSYTLLPAPEPGSYACAGTQLEPLGTVRGIDRTLSPRALLQDSAFLQVALNIALFLPFGYLVRAVARRGVVVATLAGAVVSLSIELTQLTGVWGVYECAYRVFDVDDLILNTTGALIGSVVAIPFVAVLHRGARRPPPARITIGRRWTGLLCDLLVVMLLSGAVGVAFNAWALYVQQIPFERWDTGLRDALQLGVPLAVQAVCVLVRGQSVGEVVVQLQTAPPRPISAPALLLRRMVKLVLGAGAGTVLLVADVPGLLLPVFALITLAAPLADAERRGLATAAAGLRLRSRRAPEIERDAARTEER